MKSLTEVELRNAKRVLREWKQTGDINLLGWIDYQLSQIKKLAVKHPNTIKSTAKSAVVKARRKVVLKSKTGKKS